MHSGENYVPGSSIAPSQRSGVAIFRTWILLAVAGSVWGAIAIRLDAPRVFVWMILAEAECWCLFGSWQRCFAWIALAGLTGSSLAEGIRGFHMTREWLFLVLIGASEALVCLGVRKRPWLWAAVVPVIYGTIGQWTPITDAWGLWIKAKAATLVPGTAPLMVNTLDGMAPLVVILVIRAFIGSFLTPPIERDLRMDRSFSRA
jgi:hypothetical protein